MSEPQSPQRPDIDALRQSLGRPKPPEDEPLGMDADEMARLAERGRREALEWRWKDIIPRRFWTASLDTLEQPPKVSDALHAWDGRANVVFFGGVGTGKTYAAIAIARVFHESTREIAFYPVPELLDELRPSPEPGRVTLEWLAKVPLLILDDLGTERGTDWTLERLSVVINRRWLNDVPTVATTNLSPEDLKACLGPRPYSRLVDENTLTLALTGPDRRRS